MSNVSTQSMVQAFDVNMDTQSPSQPAFDKQWNAIASKPVYNFINYKLDGKQKLILYFAAAGVGFLLYKYYFKKG